MQDLIVSVNKNILKISTIDKTGLNTVSSEIPENIVSDSKILDVAGFSIVLDNLIGQATKQPRNKLTLNFVVEPQDMLLKFIGVTKKEGPIEEQIINEIKARLDGEALDELYFSYEKIAPFVYQFAGVKKTFLDKLIEVGATISIDIKSIIPWVLLLPKYVNVNDPAIFLAKIGLTQVIALSELNGIFFTGVYDEEKTTDEIQKIVKELSFYKRSQPIKKVYTLNYPTITLDGEYQVTKIDIPVNSISNLAEYEVNVLASYFLDNAAQFSSSLLNFINLLPLPVVEKKNRSLVVVGTAVSALVLAVAGYGGFNLYNWYIHRPPKDAGFNANTAVLGGTNTVETSQSTSSTNTGQPGTTGENGSVSGDTATGPKKDLQTKDLKIRVENAAGKTGLAAKTRDYLAKFGYTIHSIDTSDTSRTSTLLQFKKSKIDYKDLVTADMKDKFTNLVVEDTLKDSAEYDLLILIGTDSKL